MTLIIQEKHFHKFFPAFAKLIDRIVTEYVPTYNPPLFFVIDSVTIWLRPIQGMKLVYKISTCLSRFSGNGDHSNTPLIYVQHWRHKIEMLPCYKPLSATASIEMCSLICIYFRRNFLSLRQRTQNYGIWFHTNHIFSYQAKLGIINQVGFSSENIFHPNNRAIKNQSIAD